MSASLATRTNSPVKASRLRSRISYPSFAKRSSFFRRIRFVRVGGTLICGIFALIKLCDLVQGHTSELGLRQHGEQFPTNLEGSFDRPVLCEALIDELLLERASKLEIPLVGIAQFFLTNDGGQRADILCSGIGGIELCTPARMVVAGAALTDTVLHQTGKAGEHCDRRINTCKRELAPKHYLSFGDVTGQVRHRMRDIVVRHRQDGDLGDRALACTDTTCAFVHGGKVTVQIPGIPFTAG